MTPKAQDEVSLDSGEKAFDAKKVSSGNADLIADAGKVHLGKSMVCFGETEKRYCFFNRLSGMFRSQTFSFLRNSQNPASRGAVA